MVLIGNTMLRYGYLNSVNNVFCLPRATHGEGLFLIVSTDLLDVREGRAKDGKEPSMLNGSTSSTIRPARRKMSRASCVQFCVESTADFMIVCLFILEAYPSDGYAP